MFLAICGRFYHDHQLCSWQYVLDLKSSTYCQEYNWWTWSNLAHITRNTTGEHDQIYHILPGTLSCSLTVFLSIFARFYHVHPLCFWQYVLDLITFTSCDIKLILQLLRIILKFVQNMTICLITYLAPDLNSFKTWQIVW
jgi:hypothetical protein